MIDALLLPDGTSVPMTDGMSIGRDAKCAIRLDESSVSREHSVISAIAERHWHVTDLGSRNGTFVDGVRIAPGASSALRHGTRLGIANVILVVSMPKPTPDPASTTSLELSSFETSAALSPYQLRVVRLLAAPWLLTGDQPASNAQIAEQLGTPEAGDAVKAALRRAYAKVGLSQMPAAAKRRALCRVARQRGWV